jgi:calcium-dependent protein kinase
MRCIDFDNSGRISYSEFIIASSDLKGLLSADNIGRTFAFIDTDGSGKLSAEELKARLGDHLE